MYVYICSEAEREEVGEYMYKGWVKVGEGERKRVYVIEKIYRQGVGSMVEY